MRCASRTPPAPTSYCPPAASSGCETRAFQLWVALPPELENGTSESRYVQPHEVPTVGPARVILGEYDGAKSPIGWSDAPPMTYLQVDLAPGEHWRFSPPTGHRVAWVAVAEGALREPAVPTGAVATFEASEQPIDFVAEGATRFVLGSAAPHPHDLVLGYYSVHTSERALEQGEAEIRRIGRELRRDDVDWRCASQTREPDSVDVNAS